MKANHDRLAHPYRSIANNAMVSGRDLRDAWASGHDAGREAGIELEMMVVVRWMLKTGSVLVESDPKAAACYQLIAKSIERGDHRRGGL